MDIRFTRRTAILDHGHPRIQALVETQGWKELPHVQRLPAVYDHVRNEVNFGYNSSDDLPASAVLADGFGQCNTKTALLMALLRAVGVPCRFHGATIHKQLQQGVIDGVFYRLSPEEILHSWAEVWWEDRWIELEGVILDAEYLEGLRNQVKPHGPLLGFGVGTQDMARPPVEWNGEDTAIQKTGISRDLGVHDDPDSFYRNYGTNARGIRGFLFNRVVRHRMNRRVDAIRLRSITSP